jgi:succinate dehydrogenase / fumarate reductase iron-sulfur subunit
MHMRRFKDGQTIVIEPWRARSFPVMRDLMVDRTAFDEIIMAGGYISIPTGSAPDAHSVPVRKDRADLAMDAAACIGCGACVAACKNASAMLFVSAKIAHMGMLPQGQPEAKKRVQDMVAKMDELGFGNCTNTYACEAECPKEIKVTNIAFMNRGFFGSKVGAQKRKVATGGG